MAEDNLLTVLEVRTRLKVSQQTLNKYIKAGRLPIVMVSRTKRYVKEQDLEKFIRDNTGVYKQ